MLHQLLDGIKFRGPRFFTAYQGIQGSDLSSVLFHFSGAWQAPPQRHWDWEGWADHSTFAGRKCFLLLPSVRLDTGGGRRCLAAAYSRQDTQPALRANLSRPNRDETWIWGCCERSWLEEEQEKLGFLRLEEAFWLRVPWHQGLDGWHSSESDQCFKIKVVCVCVFCNLNIIVLNVFVCCTIWDAIFLEATKPEAGCSPSRYHLSMKYISNRYSHVQYAHFFVT